MRGPHQSQQTIQCLLVSRAAVVAPDEPFHVIRLIMFAPKKISASSPPHRRFKRVLRFFARRSEMAHLHFLDKTDFITMLAQPQTKIDIFSIKEKFRIESAQRLINLAPNEHA